MVSDKLQKAVNDQIAAEMWSSNLYLQMSFYLRHEGWDGSANWMAHQAEEERGHALKMAGYLLSRGCAVKLQATDVVPEGWGTVLEVFEHTYEHECKVSSMINGIVALAIEEKDYATENFFRGFVDEQVEEEETAAAIVDKLKKAGDSGLLFVDSELGKRN